MMSKTAAEFMAELEKDDEYQAIKKAREERLANMEVLLTEDEKGLVQDLSSAGFPVSSVWDFVNSPNYYLDALPILMRHLAIEHHPRTIAGIARSLAVKDFQKSEELWSLLVYLYKKTPMDSDINVPEERGTKEALAIAIAAQTTKTRVPELKQLLESHPSEDGDLFFERRIKQFAPRKKKDKK